MRLIVWTPINIDYQMRNGNRSRPHEAPESVTHWHEYIPGRSSPHEKCAWESFGNHGMTGIIEPGTGKGEPFSQTIGSNQEEGRG